MSDAPVTGLSGGPATGRPSVTICGSGNAAHALAVVASQNLAGDIDWLVGSEAKAKTLRAAALDGGLRSTGVITGTAHRLRTISADPAEVIPDADLVIMAVPAFAHTAVINRIRPYVSDALTVACLPTRGGFEFEAAHFAPRHGNLRAQLLGLQTLPWSTRVVTLGEVVHIGAVKAEVVLAALPASQVTASAHLVSRLIGTQVVPTESFLSLTLGNPGQFIHPGLMYGHFHAWDGAEYDQEGIPLLYADATDEMGYVVDRLSQDALAVAREIEARTGHALNLGSGVLPAHDWLRKVYGHVTADTSTVGACFRTGPIQARKAPMIEVAPGNFVPDFHYRYLSEDVPFGLVITRAFADLVDIDTPMIDEVISWAQVVLNKVYLVGNALVGADASDLPIPQNFGISGVSDLIEWYSDYVYARA